MTIFVTGSTGFVGSSLCDQLVMQKRQVRASVRTPTERHPTGRMHYIHVSQVDGKTDWNGILDGVDAVVHLAAHVHIVKKLPENSKRFFEVNFEGTRRLAESAVAAGVKRFIYLSTVKVHGEHTESCPFQECDPFLPQDDYARSKAAAEKTLIEIAKNTKMQYVIIRPPLVYGPGVKANFHALLQVVAKGIPLPLDSIKNSRSMIYRGNLVDALISCLDRPEAANQTFLVSDMQDVSTPQLIRMIAQAMEKPPRLFSLPPVLLEAVASAAGKRAAASRLLGSLQVDSSLIRNTLRWIPPYTVESGIAATVRSFLQGVGL